MLIWYDSAHSRTITMIKLHTDLHSQMTLIPCPYRRASYGVSFISYTKTNDHDISQVHCIAHVPIASDIFLYNSQLLNIYQEYLKIKISSSWNSLKCISWMDFFWKLKRCAIHELSFAIHSFFWSAIHYLQNIDIQRITEHRNMQNILWIRVLATKKVIKQLLM